MWRISGPVTCRRRRSSSSCWPRTCWAPTAPCRTSAAATRRRRAWPPITPAARSRPCGSRARAPTWRRWGASTSRALRLDEVLPLMERDSMSDEDMVAYLARCQLDPAAPRASIETLLHAFVPAPHVHHTHPDGINVLAGAANGEALVRECFGDDAAWIPYIRPGLHAVQAGRHRGARQPGAEARRAGQARADRVGRHGRGGVPQDDRGDQPGRRLRQRAHGRHAALRRSQGWSRPARCPSCCRRSAARCRASARRC